MTKNTIYVLIALLLLTISISGCVKPPEEITCKAAWTCTDNYTLAYKKTDCTFISTQKCKYGCDANKCVGEPMLPAPVIQRVEETDAAFIFSDAFWKSEQHEGLSGGAFIGSSSPGATADIGFTGTGVALISIKSPNGGIAKIEIDKKYYGTIDFYSEQVTPMREIISSDLQKGKHNLRITVTGNKNINANNSVIIIDAVDITS